MAAVDELEGIATYIFKWNALSDACPKCRRLNQREFYDQDINQGVLWALGEGEIWNLDNDHSMAHCKHAAENATTGLVSTSLTEDDDSTPTYFIVCYEKPDYPMEKVYKAKGVDLLFLIHTPTVRTAGVKVRYIESTPIQIACIDKPGITGTKLRWKGEKELRRVIKAYPLGSFHSMDRSEPSDERLGSTVIHSVTLTANIRRTAS